MCTSPSGIWTRRQVRVYLENIFCGLPGNGLSVCRGNSANAKLGKWLWSVHHNPHHSSRNDRAEKVLDIADYPVNQIGHVLVWHSFCISAHVCQRSIVAVCIWVGWAVLFLKATFSKLLPICHSLHLA